MNGDSSARISTVADKAFLAKILILILISPRKHILIVVIRSLFEALLMGTHDT